jgi:hypothetical protein
MRSQIIFGMLLCFSLAPITSIAAEKKETEGGRKPASLTSPYDSTDMDRVNKGNPVLARLLFSAGSSSKVTIHLTDVSGRAPVSYYVSKSKGFELNLLKDLMLKNKQFRAQLDSDGEPTIIEVAE